MCPCLPILKSIGANWKTSGSMLAHQLPILPPYENFWEELPAFLNGLQVA